MTQHILVKHVLVADDNQAAADLLCEMLILSGYPSICAYDGFAAMQVALSYLPDAIILDIGMPGMDGFAVATALRAQPQFANTLIIALTAWGDAATRARTRDAGFDCHLVKPASINVILDALDLTPARNGMAEDSCTTHAIQP